MNKGMSSLLAGVSAGMIAGGIAMLARQHHSPMPRVAKNMKKNTEKALRSVGTMMEDLSDMMH